MSNDWEDMFPLVNMKKLVREVSDHNALLLYYDNHVIRAPQKREFRFDQNWLKSEDFVPLVSRIWNQKVNATDPIDILNIKLKRFKKFLKAGDRINSVMRKKKARD